MSLHFSLTTPIVYGHFIFKVPFFETSFFASWNTPTVCDMYKDAKDFFKQNNTPTMNLDLYYHYFY